ncbi:MAG: hypothetical protein H6825_15685 [Planctomycetes bacterium]|nr:hypothetical protein [Planctomycetota bacterium]
MIPAPKILVRVTAALLVLGVTAFVAACASSSGDAPARDTPRLSASAAWDVIYDVLQSPRCLNCHPAGDTPLVGDESLPHPQNVRRGPNGSGVFGMRCDTCHQDRNLSDAHLPPGAPNWHLPHPALPLIFEGRDKSALCEQLRDPARNGRKSPAQLAEHMLHDPLVLWGWDPGPGRAAVPIPREVFDAAVEDWVAGDCGCPDDDG